MDERASIAKRPYSNTLRQQQSQATRELILRAAREIAAENRILFFTIEEVADRAGVSHRSIYRYFPTKESLLKAASESRKDLVDLFRTDTIAKFRDIPTFIERVFAFFDEHPAGFRAFNVYDLAFKVDLSTREEGDKLIRQSLESLAPGMEAKEAERVFAVTRFLISSFAWQILQDRYNLNSREARKAVEWAVTALIRDVKKNSGEK